MAMSLVRSISGSSGRISNFFDRYRARYVSAVQLLPLPYFQQNPYLVVRSSYAIMHHLPEEETMRTMTLRHLEERLEREAPALEWQCEPVQGAPILTGTNLPEEIQVRASNGGVPVKGSPFYLSGECLLRWGFDASATMICNELTPTVHSASQRVGMDWDRLAEI